MASTVSLYKFNEIEATRVRKTAWLTSILFHAGINIIVLLVLFWKPRTEIEKMDFEIFVQPKQAPDAEIRPIRPRSEARPQPKVKQVFGQSRKAITSETGIDLQVKAGNTIAKAIDQEQLKKDDPDPVPVPADEFLVTEMPKIKTEVRIAYPKEAREKGIQGAVLMDLLIDSKGRVREVVLIQGPGYGLNEAAVEAAKGFEFQPARVQDQPVAVKIRYAYRFVLER